MMSSPPGPAQTRWTSSTRRIPGLSFSTFVNRGSPVRICVARLGPTPMFHFLYWVPSAIWQTWLSCWRLGLTAM